MIDKFFCYHLAGRLPILYCSYAILSKKNTNQLIKLYFHDLRKKNMILKIAQKK